MEWDLTLCKLAIHHQRNGVWYVILPPSRFLHGLFGSWHHGKVISLFYPWWGNKYPDEEISNEQIWTNSLLMSSPSSFNIHEISFRVLYWQRHANETVHCDLMNTSLIKRNCESLHMTILWVIDGKWQNAVYSFLSYITFLLFQSVTQRSSPVFCHS